MTVLVGRGGSNTILHSLSFFFTDLVVIIMG